MKTKRPSSRSKSPSLAKPARRARSQVTTRKRAASAPLPLRLLYLALECSGLAAVLLTVVVVALGLGAERFAGTGLLANLLPFAGGVLALLVIGALGLIGWWRLRGWLLRRASGAPAWAALLLALAVGTVLLRHDLSSVYRDFRTLVGSTEEAERVTIAHQVYAAYRRATPAQLQQLMVRAESYNVPIGAAAAAFGLEPNLLYGLAACESSFLPRDSRDGGRGLFQITRVPAFILAEARSKLGGAAIDLADARHNAFVAAATLQYYLKQMRGDLFLGLLAYNIGPANGGLHFIMQQYGARDFVTIQPYLQQLPRDYPIRVLSYALAFRIWHTEKRLLAYEEGGNASRIQNLGIPGFDRGL